MNQIWNMPKKAAKISTIDQQKNKRNIKCDEDMTFLLVVQGITQMYHIKL
jgi:hypothetical protein